MNTFLMILLPLVIVVGIVNCVSYWVSHSSKEVLYEKYPVDNVGHGRASKIEYSGHSYIVWQQNLSDCIIHDPDCRCFSKD